MKTGLKVLVVLLLGILVQTTFGADLRVNNVAPDLMLLLAVCAGLRRRPRRGGRGRVCGGLLSDLFLQNTPFGLSALAGCLAGFIAGWARHRTSCAHAWPSCPLVAAAGTALGCSPLRRHRATSSGRPSWSRPGRRWLVEVAVVEATYAALFSAARGGVDGLGAGGSHGGPCKR